MKKLLAFVLLGGLFAAGYLAANLDLTGPAPASATLAPPAASVDADRVFEMRTYFAHEGRMDALQRRFRDHTTRLFEKHGMNNIGYWIPQDAEAAPNTLVYIIAHPSREAARESWRAFATDPEWREAQAASEADGPIVQRIESVFLVPTDYSPLR
jgi:hypothetical protein